jgi:predicted ATPase/DNA-binding CsgD family transcriptional regulator
MIDPLTERELEILRLLSQGMTNQAIADQLYLSRGTVKAHNHNLFSKLGVTSRTQALLKAQELGLIDSVEMVSSAPLVQEPKLPVPLMPLLGREAELFRLAGLLSDSRVRLITMLGAGGMGKTHTAIEAARRQAAQFTDGVYFVSLARVAHASQLATAIIEDIGLQFRVNVPPAQQLSGFLQNKNCLLVLDNFEHLLDATDLLADLLQDAPGVKLLVTSRERLRLSNEVLLVLEGLNYKLLAETDSPLEASAVQLVLQRGQLVRPEFTLTAKNWPHIQRICQLTQGMPLAIILAMGWLEMLSVEEIADEISHSLDILESQLLDVPERQRSMRATIASSWQRLTVEEKRVFASLSVFQGGFTREAARNIVGADLRDLQTLVNRSFLTANEGRFEIHELLRQYGWQELQRATHAPEVYTVHSHYYLQWLTQLEDDLKGRRQIEALHEVGRDLDNIRLAWEWAYHTQRYDLIDGAVESLFVYFTIENRLQDGIELFQQVLEPLLRSPEEYQSIICRLKIRMYSMAMFSNAQIVNKADLAECVQAIEKSGNAQDSAVALIAWCTYCSYVERNFQVHLDQAERVISFCMQAEDMYHLATAYHRIGYCHLQVTGMDALIEFSRKQYDISRQTGNLYTLRAALATLGSAALYQGRYREAEMYYRESNPIVEQFGPYASRGHFINFTHVLFLLGKFDEAEDLLKTVWDGTHTALERASIAFGYAMRGFSLAIDEEYEEALQCALQGIRESPHDITGTLVSHQIASMAYCGMRDPLNAEKHLCASWRCSQQMAFYASTTWGLPMLVMICFQRQEPEQALRYASLMRTHPLSAKDWLDAWPLLLETETNLKQSFTLDQYEQLWEQGVGLNLETVVADVLNAAGSEV